MNVEEKIQTDMVRTNFTLTNRTGEQDNLENSPLRIVVEGDQNFYNYIKKIGISDDSDLIILSSRNHYYYGESDLKNVRTIINLKKLNLIKHLDKFLKSLIHILPPETSFLGCFSDNDNRTTDRNGHKLSMISKYVERVNNFLDLKTDRDMNQKKVTDLLLSHGFKIFDMSKIDGVTYFHSKLV